MTTPAIAEATASLRESVEPARHLDAALVRLANWWHSRDTTFIDADLGDEDRDRLHAFLRRFEQAYDLVSRKILRGLLVVAAEDPKEFSRRELFHWAEKTSALPSAESWLVLGDLRNRLVHEYPVALDIQLDHVVEAMKALPALREAIAGSLARVSEALR